MGVHNKDPEQKKFNIGTQKWPYKLGWRLHRRLLLGTRHLAPDFLDEIPLGVEGLEPVQSAVGSVEGSKLDLVAVTLALLKVDKPFEAQTNLKKSLRAKTKSF